MSDKIAEIRARHEAGAPGEMPIAALCQCDADREFLLAEVDRLRSVISTLEIVGKASDDERAKFFAEIKRLHQAHETACQGGELLREEIKRLTRERDEARAALKPFSMLYLWPDDADKWTRNEIRSEEDWDETRNDARTDDVFIRRGHIRAARKALEAKP